jgi:hypothetical protein
VAQSEQQRKANLRLALILATVALCFGAGFMVKMIFFGHH